MIPDRWLQSEVGVLGFARTGRATARYLSQLGASVYVSDSSDSPEMRGAAEELKNSHGVSIDLGQHDLSRIAECSLVVPSPGVPPDAPPLRTAREAGVEVVAELELAWKALDRVPFVVITGTNGKSTVTALVAWILETAGSDYFVGGNIGRPAIEAAMLDSRPECAVVEASSFQLHDCHSLAPSVGVLTNLSPDHLDRYSSVEAYYADKERLFQNAQADSCWIVNGDDPAAMRMTEMVRGDRHTFSTLEKGDAWFDRDNRSLMLDEIPFVNARDLRIIGEHNMGNVLAAALVARRLGVATGALARASTSFGGLPDRLEMVGELDGAVWINDSKATNVDAAATAIAAMDRDFVLLLGGRHKGNPYRQLLPLLEPHCVGVIAYGESGPLIAADLASRVRVIPAPGDFESVLQKAREAAPLGGIVLLSPACSSFDMFRNYEERGDQFRSFVQNAPASA